MLIANHGKNSPPCLPRGKVRVSMFLKSFFTIKDLLRPPPNPNQFACPEESFDQGEERVMKTTMKWRQNYWFCTDRLQRWVAIRSQEEKEWVFHENRWITEGERAIRPTVLKGGKMIYSPLAVLNRQWDQQCCDLGKTMDTTDRATAALPTDQLFKWLESI